MWTSLFRKAAAEPTLSPEQKAEAAFNELSPYITAHMIPDIKSQHSSSTAVAEGVQYCKACAH